MPHLIRSLSILPFLFLLCANNSKGQTLDTTAMLQTKVYVLMKDSSEHIGKFAQQHAKYLIVFTRAGRQQLLRKDLAQLTAYKDYKAANGIQSSFEAFRKNAIYFNIGGSTPTAGIVFERQVHDLVAFEVGFGKADFGDQLTLGTGIKVTLQGVTKRRFPLHFGLHSTFAFDEGAKRLFLYFPLGFSYSSPTTRMTVGADIGPAIKADEDVPVRWGTLKLGLRF